jgi:hypothetical protein
MLALAAVGCSSSKQAAPPVTVPVTESTVPATSTTSTTSKPTTTVSTVPRTTVTTQLSLGPGDATIAGTVSGPAGPVDGATVRIERLVGKGVATQDVTTSGGSWQLPSVLGGSYRVRAFKPPDLVQSDVQVFFLAANERKVIDFKLVAAGGDRILAVVNPSPPRLGQPATLTVTVGTGRVDDQGRPSIAPRPGVVVVLSGGPGFVVDSVPQVTTDGNGAAAWSIRCTTEGANSLPMTVGGGVTAVILPACGSAPVAATTTTKAG